MNLTRFLACALICAGLLLYPSTARGDATVFIGSTLTPENRLARGVAIGVTLLIVGFEFEYSHTSEDLDELAPSLTSGMGNVLIQTPFGAFQPYGTIGAGVYREKLEEISSETHFGTNFGGGVKISLAGPLRLRVDYRIFALQGRPRHSKPQRIYAGLNLAF
jgi:opacity protein-like surface antigen